MKKNDHHAIKIVLFLVVFIFVIWAVTHGSSIKPSTQITIASHTIYLNGNNAIPDSVMIITRYNGTIVYSAWFNSGDAEATADSGELVFTDQLQDIDGAGGDGVYLITARAYSKDSTLYTNWHYSYDVGVADNIEDIKSSIEPTLNRLNIYVDTGGSDDSSGLTWNTAVASVRIAESKCTGADEYFIYIAPGSYASQSCTIDVANVRIIGAGWENTVLNTVSGKPIITVNHVGRGLAVSGITFVGDWIAGQYGVYLVDIDGFHIHDSRFQNCRMAICGIANANEGLIENIYAYASDWDGVVMTGKQIIVRNVVIDSLDQSGADGIYFQSAHNAAYGNYVFSAEGANAFRGPGNYSYLFANNYGFVNGGVDFPYTNKDLPAIIGNHQRSFIDSTGSTEKDIYAVYAEADSALDDVRDLEKFLGAKDGYYQKIYPLGSANKDSVRVYNSSDDHLGTLYYFHTGAIIDSVRWEIW